MNIKAILEKYYNCYDNIGKFNFRGNTIAVFRRCGYYAGENFVEGDEAVRAIVNEEYVTDWYNPEDYDPEWAIKDAVRYIIETKKINIQFKIIGKFNYDLLENHQEIKGQIKHVLKNIMIECVGDTKAASLYLMDVDINRNAGTCEFVASVDGDWEMYDTMIEYDGDFSIWCINGIDEMSLDFMQLEDRELFDTMFSYETDFL